MARSAKQEEDASVAAAKRWKVDPLAWIRDMFGDNLRDAFTSYTGKPPLTETGLTVQQEAAFKELGQIIRAKLKVHKGLELTEKEKSYASKIGMSIMSGTGTGKDFFTALCVMYMLSAFGSNNPPEPPLVACTANTAKQLRNVLWATISRVIKMSRKVDPNNPDSRTILEELFEWQSERVFLRRNKGETWFAEGTTISARSSDDEQAVALGGRHGKYMLLVADEASGIPDGVFKPLEGTLTGAVNLLLIIFNPTRTTGFAIDSQRDPRFIAMRWNSEDSEIVSKSQIETMEAKYGRDSNTFRIRVLGLPPLADDDSLIPWDWVEDARNREIEPLKEDYVLKSCDFGAGGDKSIIATSKGGKVYPFKRNTTKDSNILTDWVYDDFLASGADMLLGDCIGIGWAVVGNLRARIGGAKVRSIDSRGKPHSDRFANVRAENYWRLREEFENKAISLSALSDDEYREVADQIGATKYKSETGKIAIIRKDKIKETLGHSPDELDALAQRKAVAETSLRKSSDYDDDPDYKRKRRSAQDTGSRNWMRA